MHFDPRNTPYSFSLSFLAWAILRSSMLCACEPVKYCIAAPKQDGSTTRRSTWRPLDRRTVERVSPWEATWVTSLNLPNRSITAGALAQLTTMSRSPIVSLRRRKVPATSMASIPPPALRYSTIARAYCSASCSTMRLWATAPPATPSRIFSSSLGPKPPSFAILPCSSASLRSATLFTFSTSWKSLTRLGPRPGMRNRSSRPGGTIADAGKVGEVELGAGDELGDGIRVISHGARRVAIRANLERIACRDLEKIGDFAQQTGDLGVLHC